MSVLSDVVPRVRPVRDAAANAVAEDPRAEGRARLAWGGCEARPREPGTDPAFVDRSRDPFGDRFESVCGAGSRPVLAGSPPNLAGTKGLARGSGPSTLDRSRAEARKRSRATGPPRWPIARFSDRRRSAIGTNGQPVLETAPPYAVPASARKPRGVSLPVRNVNAASPSGPKASGISVAPIG